MVDIGTLRLIIDSLVAIETAAKNVEQNEKDCKQMGKYIGLLTRNLRRIQNNELLLMRMDSDLSATVEAIKEINDEAKMLVEECKVKRNIMCRLWTAGEISKKLSLMNQSINTTTNFLILAINNRQLEYQQDLLSSLHGDHPRPVQKINYLIRITLLHLRYILPITYQLLFLEEGKVPTATLLSIIDR